MYYPLSQIKTNLYTNGGEYAILSSGQNYIGYYFKISTGKYYTGKTPQDLPNDELTFITTFSSVPEILTKTPLNIDVGEVKNVPYIDLSNTNLNQVSYLPYYSPQLPTQQNYQNGVFRRYFVKKTNEIIYIEVNKDTYENITNKNPQWAYQYYITFNIPWVISGDKLTVAKTNKNIVDLTMQRFNLPKFNMYLRNNYLKFYK
jgi:hypothetical protein